MFLLIILNILKAEGTFHLVESIGSIRHRVYTALFAFVGSGKGGRSSISVLMFVRNCSKLQYRRSYVRS